MKISMNRIISAGGNSLLGYNVKHVRFKKKEQMISNKKHSKER